MGRRYKRPHSPCGLLLNLQNPSPRSFLGEGAHSPSPTPSGLQAQAGVLQTLVLNHTAPAGSAEGSRQREPQYGWGLSAGVGSWLANPGLTGLSFSSYGEVLTLAVFLVVLTGLPCECLGGGGPVLTQALTQAPGPADLTWPGGCPVLEAGPFWNCRLRREGTGIRLSTAVERQGRASSAFALKRLNLEHGVNRARQPPDLRDPRALNRGARVCKNGFSLHSNFNTNKRILFQGRRKVLNASAAGHGAPPLGGAGGQGATPGLRDQRRHSAIERTPPADDREPRLGGGLLLVKSGWDSATLG